MDVPNHLYPRHAWVAPDETTEERLFKFSPLSSTKLEEGRESASNNTISATSPLFVNGSQSSQVRTESYLDHRQRIAFTLQNNVTQPVVSRVDTSFDSSPNPGVAIRQPNFDLESLHARTAEPSQVMPPAIKERENSVVHVLQPHATPQTAFRGEKRERSTVGVQTVERSHSPFDTYDLLFVKELVNNLNKDNEVLNGNIEDLKTAFLFLHEKHKQLLKLYQKECLNRDVIEAQKEKMLDMRRAQDKLAAENLIIKDKQTSLLDVLRISWEEHQQQLEEDDILIDELVAENKSLREMLKISTESGSTQEIETALRQ